MADYGDTQDQTPLVPQAQPSDVPTQQQTVGLADQWRGWMADPHNRASLIQFGLALSQPISAGQNIGGHIGQALGAGGEASDRVTAAQQREEELASKQELRTAQADLAGQRAETSGAKAGAAGDRLAFLRDKLAGDVENKSLRANIAIRGQYDRHVGAITRQNAEITKRNTTYGTATPLLPVPTLEEYTGSIGGGGGGGAGASVAPVPVQTPDEVGKLPSGTRYITPDGRTGTAP